MAWRRCGFNSRWVQTAGHAPAIRADVAESSIPHKAEVVGLEFKAIAFDMDGTLIEERSSWLKAHAAIGVKGAPTGSALEVAAEGTASLTLGRPSERTLQLDGLRLR